MGKIVDEGALSSAFTKLNEWLTTRKATLDDNGLLKRSELPQIAMPFDGFIEGDHTVQNGSPSIMAGVKIKFSKTKGGFYAEKSFMYYKSFPGRSEYMKTATLEDSTEHPLAGKLFIYKNDIYVAKESEDGTWSLQPLTAINDLLADYLTEDNLTETLQDYVTNTALNGKGYVTNTSLNTTLGSYVTNTALNNKGYATTTALNNAVADCVKNDDITYMTPAEAEALVNELFV